MVGAIDLISAVADRDVEQPWLLALVGLVSITAGIVVAVWPAPTITVIAWVAGFYLIVFGLLGVVQGFQLRSLTTS